MYWLPRLTYILLCNVNIIRQTYTYTYTYIHWSIHTYYIHIQIHIYIHICFCLVCVHMCLVTCRQSEYWFDFERGRTRPHPRQNFFLSLLPSYDVNLLFLVRKNIYDVCILYIYCSTPWTTQYSHVNGMLVTILEFRITFVAPLALFIPLQTSDDWHIFLIMFQFVYYFFFVVEILMWIDEI